jgi:electron-transferring-flavoprotein dehydrogenase
MTIIAEGGRGALARLLADRFKLNEGRAAQVYATGVKEVWELPPGHFHKGRVIHTMGWPLKQDAYGGGFIYELSRNRIAIGFVVGLDYRDPFLDPHHEFQRFKTHPKIRALLEGGKMVEYGAKTLPEGGWEAVPKPAMPGAMLVGDAAGFLDALRLKGVHHAIKSGMLAAESAFEALDDPSKATEAYEKNASDSSIGKELRASRHFKKGFKLGFIPGVIGAAAGEATGGWSAFAAVLLEEGHRHMRTVKRYHGADGAKPERLAFDEKTTFQKMTSVYNSGTTHEEDQPCHLRVDKPELCAERCTREYGNPCQYFCPAGVYEWVEPGKLQINASNCVHCKTCDIMDPYGIIRWVPPEGGGGPGYVNL